MFAKTFLSVLVLAVLGYFVGIWIIAEQFEKDVKRLFLSADRAKYRTFQLTQLGGLPAPVQSYFKQVIAVVENHSYQIIQKIITSEIIALSQI